MGLNERYDGDIHRAVLSPLEVLERTTEEGDPIMSGTFSVFDRWTEIDSAFEGQFMERVAPGAFRKSVAENLNNIRVTFSHGMDRSLGGTVLGKLLDISEQTEGATYDASLFRSVPQLLVDGLKAGVYGASFRGDPIKTKVDYKPKRSEQNPKGLPEVTRTEIRLKDVGPTERPAYAETTSFVRCITDELAFGNLLAAPDLIRSLIEQGAATLDREEEPDAKEMPSWVNNVASYSDKLEKGIERTTPSEDEPTHSAEEIVEKKEELPSWHLSR